MGRWQFAHLGPFDSFVRSTRFRVEQNAQATTPRGGWSDGLMFPS
jgi:hypothetical protein